VCDLDIITFKESKGWYDDRGIPFRRGILLYGPPGTGKTSFIQSLASEIKMNVAILSLSAAADDDSLSNVLARVPKNSLLVIEDIDHYKFEEGTSGKEKSDGRGGESKKSISVSGILNAIDGIASVEESSKISIKGQKEKKRQLIFIDCYCYFF
jgi:KaiC/GvpD/RAD55 family RecA-like ATPase